MKRVSQKNARGFTLVELIVATAILMVLTSLAIPMARIGIKRERERELRHDLWAMRDAIDRYKDAADRGAFQIKVGSEGYPPDLETLVKRRGCRWQKSPLPAPDSYRSYDWQYEWGTRSLQDDPDSDSSGGDNVFDVYTKSTGTGLDGTEYKSW